MEVDQEGVGDQEVAGVQLTEQINLEIATHHQYNAAPSGGWNHDREEHTQAREAPVIDLDIEFDIREDILRLKRRICEAAIQASGKDE
eukprot:12058943-Heterocapsa_arctica.AAC.1